MSIAVQAVRGVAWNFVVGAGARAISLIGTLALTHFIRPADYGAVEAAAICVVTAYLVCSFSLGQYLVVQREAGPAVAFHAAVCHAALAGVAMALVVALRGPLGRFVDAPGVEPYVGAMALAMFVKSVGYIPERLLIRDLRFRVVALGRGLGEIAFTGVALASAPWIGPKGLVLGFVARSLCTTAIYAASVPPAAWLAPSRPRWSTVKAIFGFGAPLSIATLSEYASQFWDNLLVSRLFGPGVMGVYKLAYNLADVPTAGVAENIGDVLLPSFSRMSAAHRPEALGRALGLMALLCFPLAVGLAATSTTLVDALFTDEWAGIAPMLAILSSMSIVRPLSWAAVTFLQAERRLRALMTLAVLKVVVLLAAIATIGRLGPLWTCGAVSLVIAAHTAALLAVARRVRGVPLALAREIAPPLLACLPMVASVLAVRRLIDGAAPMLLLVVEIAAGAATYAVAAWLIAPRQRTHLVRLVGQAWRRRAAEAPAG